MLETLPTDPWPLCPCPLVWRRDVMSTKLLLSASAALNPCPLQVSVGQLQPQVRVEFCSLRSGTHHWPLQSSSFQGGAIQKGNVQDNVGVSGSRAVPLQGAQTNTARTCENSAHEQKSVHFMVCFKALPCWPKSSV